MTEQEIIEKFEDMGYRYEPIIIDNENCFIWWLFVLNLIVHFITDHLKANLYKINLIVDQSIHLIQIILTWLICFII